MTENADPAGAQRRQAGQSVGRASSLLWWLAGTVILLGTLALLWGANMRRGLNHDEHQFVAAGTLIARTGAMPYRDFPYFHMPLLAYLNAAIFQWNDSLLLTARTLSVAAAWGALIWIFTLGRRLGAGVHALLAGSAAIALLLMTPLVLYTSGRAWNHDAPMLLALCAIGTQHAALGQRGRNRWGLLVLTGALVGLAAATRSSYLFLAPGFALALALAQLPRRELLAAWTALLIGGVSGGAPALWLLIQEPAGFWFGNWVYNVQLNPAWYRAEGAADQMTVMGKLGSLGGLWLAQPANLLVPLLLVGVLVLAWPRRREWSSLAGLALLLLPFALAGALSASPAQPQYWYPLYPLALVAMLALLPAVGRPVVGIAALGATALLAILLTGPAYGDGVQILTEAERWYPNKIHRRGGQMAALVGELPGEVITLAPIWPLEGKLDIDPSLVTGSLGFRVADLVEPDVRRARNLTNAADLIARMEAVPPRAIAVGFEADDAPHEAPLVDFARRHDYLPVTLEDEGILWLSPVAEWGGAIRLGAQTLGERILQPGTTEQVVFYEMATVRLTHEYNVLVRLVGSDGFEAARSEGFPWGRPTTNWTPGEVWPDGHMLAIAPATPPGIYRLEMAFYDAASLEMLGSPVTVAHVPVGVTPYGADAGALAGFGPAIELMEVQLPGAAVVPGATVPLTLTWRATQPAGGPYTLFLHLVGADGAPVAQRDGEPLGGLYPTTLWRINLPVPDRIALTLPVDVAPGDYRLLVGWYDPATGVRLPVMSGGAPAGDSYAVGVLQIR